jgi:tetratricopeptide (TPR) repeat protein
MIIVLPFIIIGALVIAIAIILVKMIVAPKRTAHLAQLYKQGRHSQVIKNAKQILAKEPRSTDAHYFLGMSYLGENKPELALMELKHVDEIGLFEGQVSELPFRKTIAELYLRFNQLDEAQKEYLLLINLEPEEPEHYYQAGKLFELRNAPDKAVKYYRKTIDMDKRHADSYARLGSILFRAKRLPEAREALEQAVKLQPGNAAACFSLGKIYKESKDFQTALGYYEKAAKDQEFKLKALMDRGACLIGMGDLVRAQAELERAVKMSTEESSNETIFTRYLLAYCYEQDKKYDEAIAQWEKINAKKPNFRDVPAKLAQYQDLRNDDHMKDYLTSGGDDFVALCRGIIEKMGLQVLDANFLENGLEMLAGESTAKWRNTKKLPSVFWFLQETDTVEESVVRTLHEKVKGGNFNRGILIVSATISRGAKEFAESRPIDLVDKDKLQNLLSGGQAPAT